MDAQDAFEIFAPACVAAISPYLNADPTITHARILNTLRGGSSAAIIFRSADRQWAPSGDAMYMDFFMTLVEAYYESWYHVDQDQIPSFLIVDYDIVNESLEADFRYDELQPGIPVMEQITESVWLDGWIERYFTTGDDSSGYILPDHFDVNTVAERNEQGYPLH